MTTAAIALSASAGAARAGLPPPGLPVIGGHARLIGSFRMRGTITAARGVAGERRGERIVRRWRFAGRGCGPSFCRVLVLHRQRGDDRFSVVRLTRRSDGSYSGAGRFDGPLRCRGRTDPHGVTVPYTVTVHITRAVTEQGIPFAVALTARYRDRRRHDNTVCPIGPSHDAARYVGVASPVVSPPRAGFTEAGSPSDDDVSFVAASARGADGAPIVSRSWRFGDPASGAADASTQTDPQHTFSAPGDYEVSLTVVDANGLRSTASQLVAVP